MLNTLGAIRRQGILCFLRDLAAWGKVEADQVKAWSGVRNAVMHGNLVSPWSVDDSGGTRSGISQVSLDFRRISLGQRHVVTRREPLQA
jgi:hypothetical protein